MLDTAGFSDLRVYIKRRIVYARYRANGVWRETYLSDVRVRPDGKVRVQLNINSDGNVIKVDRVELYNTDRQLWAHQDCNISLNAGQTGILFWFDFNITEEEEG